MLRAWVTVACSAVLAAAARPQVNAARTWDHGTWTEIANYADARGEHLVNPQRITFCGHHLVVLDFDDAHVSAFDLDQAFRWRLGRSGGGPGEFRAPGSVDCDGNGRVWVPDRGNGRMQVVSSTGRVLKSIPIASPVRRLGVMPDGSAAWGIGGGAEDLTTKFDSTGKERLRVALPPWLSKYNALQREAFIAATPDGGAVISFRWSSVLVRIRPDGAVDSLAGAGELIPFPEYRAYPTASGRARMMRIKPGAPEATRGVYVIGDTVNVIATGHQSDQAIIDRYRIDGKYLGSRRLPYMPLSVCGWGPDVFVLLNDPVPGMVKLRWSRASRSN
jgi:hypothetical protein